MEPQRLTPEEAERAGFAYWTERDMALDHDHCFLCGTELNDENRTDEHVFPQWLLGDYDLWNEELTLLNGTTIPYRSLKIPCCQRCNTYWLSNIENKVSMAFREGADAVAALDPTLLTLWIAKIYYGVHFKELALPADRREPGGNPIVPVEEFERFAELHHVLQAMRQRVRFDRVPGSVYVFTAQVPDDLALRFDYRDSRLSPFIALRIGGTVVLASLLDWELMKNVVTATRFDDARRLELHPFQFAEVAGYAAYVSANFNRRFAFLARPEGDHDVIEPILVQAADDDPEAPPFGPFDMEECALFLATYMGLDVDDVYNRAIDSLWSSLRNDDGTPNEMPLDRVPADARVIPAWRAGEHQDIEPLD